MKAELLEWYKLQWLPFDNKKGKCDIILGILRTEEPRGICEVSKFKRHRYYFKMYGVGAGFSKVPVTFRARNQIFKSKYKE